MTAFQQAINDGKVFECGECPDENGREFIEYTEGDERRRVTLTKRRETALYEAGYECREMGGKIIFLLRPTLWEELRSLEGRMGLTAKEIQEGNLPLGADELYRIYQDIKRLADDVKKHEPRHRVRVPYIVSGYED